MNHNIDQSSGRFTSLRRVTHTQNLPHMGQRIVKTAVAVFLCLVVYILRGYQGMVTQSTVAAIICMQPFHTDALTAAFNRVVGTLVGAAWGLLFLLILDSIPLLSVNMPVVYLSMSVGVALSLYCCVVLRKSDSAALAAIVFICIVVGYPNLEQPLIQTADRIIDTVIGIAVAVSVDSLHLPREKHPEYVFFIHLQDLVQDRFTTVASSVLVMLNRLSGEGANICLISKWAPAFLLSQMGLVKLRLPVIVMDGAAIYDIDSGNYMDVAALSPSSTAYLCRTLEEMGLCYQIYAVRERTMVIYRRGTSNWAEEKEYQMMKRSPYRNYMEGNCSDDDHITFIRVLASVVQMDLLEEQLRNRIPKDMCRIVRRKQPRLDGYCGLYFYAPEATVENRKKTLLKCAEERYQKSLPKGTEAKPLEVFHVTPSHMDYIPERDVLGLLARVRHIYSPIDLKKLLPHREK